MNRDDQNERLIGIAAVEPDPDRDILPAEGKRRCCALWP